MGVRDACVAVLLLVAAGGACSRTSSQKELPRDGRDDADSAGPELDAASGEGPSSCTYADGGVPVAHAAGTSECPNAGCPAGTVCVEEIGATNGGQWCAPLPVACHGVPTCACFENCACVNALGRQPETCTERPGFITCDNHIRN